VLGYGKDNWLEVDFPERDTFFSIGMGIAEPVNAYGELVIKDIFGVRCVKESYFERVVDDSSWLIYLVVRLYAAVANRGGYVNGICLDYAKKGGTRGLFFA
jgi:hypothetical protein